VQSSVTTPPRSPLRPPVSAGGTRPTGGAPDPPLPAKSRPLHPFTPEYLYRGCGPEDTALFRGDTERRAAFAPDAPTRPGPPVGRGSGGRPPPNMVPKHCICCQESVWDRFGTFLFILFTPGTPFYPRKPLAMGLVFFGPFFPQPLLGPRASGLGCGPHRSRRAPQVGGPKSPPPSEDPPPCGCGTPILMPEYATDCQIDKGNKSTPEGPQGSGGLSTPGSPVCKRKGTVRKRYLSILSEPAGGPYGRRLTPRHGMGHCIPP